MAKLCTICFLLVFLFFAGEEKLVVNMAEAKDCHKVWNCKGDQRCWDDCKSRYSGKGLCDLYTAPPVPKQCFCAYKC
ncbi:Low-molecular-weight cysteine-rich [Melia azedarach]|uniref:Low-molecular-weight cysteine-rich n=1 Tax=Melia azedarach TaxID=155640 RepID=A0ACC1Y7C6_MELAZ|nr:Low-molecular-weight cysteine-rich [Melia azedarach]